MIRRAVVMAILSSLAAAVWAAWAPPPARADGLDADRCSKSAAQGGSGLGPGGQVGGGGGGGGGGSWGGGGAAAPSTTTTKPDDKEHGLCSKLMSQLIPGDEPGQFATENYDLGYDRGGALSVDRKIFGFLQNIVFEAVRWVVRVGLWLVNWSFLFEFAKRLSGPATDVANRYQSRVVGPMHLESLFLTMTAFWAGWLALTGRLTRGFTEFGTSVLLAALASTLWAHPATYLTNALEFTSGLSFEVAAVTMNDRDVQTSTEAVTRPMLAAIHKAFVEGPHEILNWGRRIPPGDRCRATYEAAVASGPWGSADEPRDAMKAAGCTAEANWNHDPSGSRVLGGLVVLVAALLAVALLVMVALTFIAAQLSIVVAIAVAPVAMVFGALAGRGRTLFWRWCASIGVAMAGVVMMAVLLSLTLMGIDALLTATDGEALMVQLVVLDVVVLVALKKRSELLNGGRRAVSGFAQRMSGSGGARQAQWHSPAVAGMAGFGAGTALNRVTSAARHHGNRGRQRELVDATRENNAAASARSIDHLDQATVTNEHLVEVIQSLQGSETTLDDIYNKLP